MIDIILINPSIDTINVSDENDDTHIKLNNIEDIHTTHINENKNKIKVIESST